MIHLVYMLNNSREKTSNQNYAKIYQKLKKCDIQQPTTTTGTQTFKECSWVKHVWLGLSLTLTLILRFTVQQ